MTMTDPTQLRSMLIGLRDSWPDDSRRLVLADYLEENGDPRAGEVREFDKRKEQFNVGQHVYSDSNGYATKRHGASDIAAIAIRNEGINVMAQILEDGGPREVTDAHGNRMHEGSIHYIEAAPAGWDELAELFPEINGLVDPKKTISHRTTWR
jgi:uncharacterized protein (TIGR02996 family)